MSIIYFSCTCLGFVGFFIGLTYSNETSIIILIPIGMIITVSFISMIILYFNDTNNNNIDEEDIENNIQDTKYKFEEYIKKYGHKINLESNIQCSICIDSVEKDKFCYEKCNHVFHKKCLREWLKQNKTCPNCRKEYP